jgi:hypothetical protein
MNGPRGEALLAVRVEIDETDVAEFNRWYEEEHRAIKLASPGYLSLRRYRLSDGSPQFLAIYELSDAQAGDPSPEGVTPWMRQIMTTWKSWDRQVWVAIDSAAEGDGQAAGSDHQAERGDVMSDEEAIRRVLAQMCQFRDSGRYDLWIQLFTPGGSFSYINNDLSGRDAIYAHVTEHFPPKGKHLCLNHIIDVSGDQATSVSDFVKIEPRNEAGYTVVATGRYEDRFARGNDGWKVSRRRVELLASGAAVGER